MANGLATRHSSDYYVGSFGLIGEYVQVSQEVSRTTTAGISRGRINNNAWQLAASWFLTGEEADFPRLYAKLDLQAGRVLGRIRADCALP